MVLLDLVEKCVEGVGEIIGLTNEAKSDEDARL